MTERPQPWSSSWPATSGKDDQRSSQRVISAQLDYIARLLEKIAGIEEPEGA